MSDFEDEKGFRVEPDTIRHFKLNLMGRRAVAAPDADSGDAETLRGPDC